MNIYLGQLVQLCLCQFQLLLRHFGVMLCKLILLLVLQKDLMMGLLIDAVRSYKSTILRWCHLTWLSGICGWMRYEKFHLSCLPFTCEIARRRHKMLWTFGGFWTCRGNWRCWTLFDSQTPFRKGELCTFFGIFRKFNRKST